MAYRKPAVRAADREEKARAALAGNDAARALGIAVRAVTRELHWLRGRRWGDADLAAASLTGVLLRVAAGIHSLHPAPPLSGRTAPAGDDLLAVFDAALHRPYGILAAIENGTA